MKNYFLIFLIISFFPVVLLAQNRVSNEYNEPYLYPWAGGMDAIQFCEIDMNLDGIKDMLAFDRRGNRKLCFINNGIEDSISFSYYPEYSDNFPDLVDWVIFADYNMDGKNDIFTYSPGYGSMMVFKNVSESELEFERVVYPYLKTLLPGGYVNLFVTNADYPAIYDIDNDGDLDILTFGVLGSFVDMHKNMSMEDYGIPDSLDYVHTTYCWGHFAESDESNVLYFDTCRPSSSVFRDYNNERHTGSTLLLNDLNDNGLADLMLGDVDYPGLYALYNEGSEDDAYISYADTLFPQSTDKVKLFSMPVAAYMDIDNNGTKDLLVSPFDPGIITSENKNSCWYYKNTGENNNPSFQLVEKNFMQNSMIDVGSGAYPLLYDWDNDGLKDLFIGNYGYYRYSYYINYFLYSVYQSKIAFYKNTGTVSKPVFQLWNMNFGNFKDLNTTGLIPAIDDLNSDGKPDFILGSEDGKIIFMQNRGDDEFDIVTKSYMDIDVGDFSAPQLFDLDGDGDKDLIIGEKAGNINYYERNDDSFSFVTDSLGKINVTDYSISWDGYSVPSFFRGVDNDTKLLVGSEQGEIFGFTNIDGNLGGKFTKLVSLDTWLDTNDVVYDRGMRTSAIFCDLIPDGKLEMIAGNYSGGLEYFNGNNTDVLSEIMDDERNVFQLAITPNPANDRIWLTGIDVQHLEYVNIINNCGSIVKKVNYVSGESIYTGDLPSGLYLITAKTASKHFIGKFILTR